MGAMMSPGPFWTHDCKACEYLDSVELTENSIGGSHWFDLYHHDAGEHTVVVRYGEEPHEYTSGIVFRDMNPLIAMACVLAKIPRDVE